MVSQFVDGTLTGEVLSKLGLIEGHFGQPVLQIAHGSRLLQRNDGVSSANLNGQEVANRIPSI